MIVMDGMDMIAWPEGFPAMQLGVAQVWRASLDSPSQPAEQLAEVLAPDEQRRAERISTEQGRLRFIASRALLRQLLSQYLGCDPAGLRFVYGPHGKPALAGVP